MTILRIGQFICEGKSISKQSFRKSVATLITGTAAAQAIPVLILPLLTRIYDPKDFGMLAVYMSIASMVSVVATAKYDMAIPLPNRYNNRQALLAISLFIATSISIIFMLSLIMLGFLKFEVNVLSNIGMLVYLLPFSVLFVGIYMGLNYWHTSCGGYADISISRVSQSLINGSVSVSAGLLSLGPGGLVLGTLAGQATAALILWRRAQKKTPGSMLEVSFRRACWLLKKYRKFPMYTAPHAISTVAKNNFVVLFISDRYTQSTVGYYYMAMRILMLPADLIGYAVGQVFYAEASKEYGRTKNIRSNVLRLMAWLFAIATIPAIFMAIYSSTIFETVFGPGWKNAGVIAGYLIPYILFHFVASPIGMVPMIVGRQREALYWGVTEGVIFVTVYVVGNMLYSDLGKSIILLSIIMPAYFIVYFMWIISVSRANPA